MAYQCPRCNGVVGALAGGCCGGVFVVMLSYVIGSMQCERCGPIPKKEFPPEVRTEMLVGSLAIVSTGAMMLVGAVYLLSLWRG
jgi:hypothetical protein